MTYFQRLAIWAHCVEGVGKVVLNEGEGGGGGRGGCGEWRGGLAVVNEERVVEGVGEAVVNEGRVVEDYINSYEGSVVKHV